MSDAQAWDPWELDRELRRRWKAVGQLNTDLDCDREVVRYMDGIPPVTFSQLRGAMRMEDFAGMVNMVQRWLRDGVIEFAPGSKRSLFDGRFQLKVKQLVMF